MPHRKTAQTSALEMANRSVLGHAEHLRAFGEALTKGVDAFMAEHRVSQAEGTWQEDLERNLAEASRVFHRILSASSQRVFDAYFGEKEPRSPATDAPSTAG